MSPAPPFDQAVRLAAGRSGYPWLDAGLLAVAYVASDDPDEGRRREAERTLLLLGQPSDLLRITARETREVQEKGKDFIRSIE